MSSWDRWSKVDLLDLYRPNQVSAVSCREPGGPTLWPGRLSVGMTGAARPHVLHPTDWSGLVFMAMCRILREAEVVRIS